MLTATIYARDLGGNPIKPDGLTIDVDWYSFGQGGPLTANLKARGGVEVIGELLQMLRCPIEIADELGRLVWWGYIGGVTIVVNGVEFGVTLDTMSNKVAMAYSFVEPGSATVGTRKTTDWVEDADSVAEYGTKEQLGSIDGATDAQAVQARDLWLAQTKYPIAAWKPAQGTGGGTATIEARGWWSTLGWRLCNIATTASVETTTQIVNAIGTFGEFFAGVRIETASGLSTSEYRDGDATVLAEIENLLKGGTTAGQRLWALVTPDRYVRILAEPAAGAADWQWLSDGRLFDGYGSSVPARDCPAGMWLERPDRLPGNVNVSQLINPTRIFVERAEYHAQGKRYQPQPRGVPGPYEIGERLRQDDLFKVLRPFILGWL